MVVHGMMSLEKLAILSVVLEDPQFNFEARIKCLSWAAVAYFVWQERNERTFKNERHHWEVMVERRLGKISKKLLGSGEQVEVMKTGFYVENGAYVIRFCLYRSVLFVCLLGGWVGGWVGLFLLLFGSRLPFCVLCVVIR